MLVTAVRSYSQIAIDTIPYANCGFGHGLKGAPNPNPPNAQAGLPFNNYANPNAILTCGKFKFYFADVQMGLPYGFNDASLGLTRRNTVCAVATYIQTIIDFAQVPAIDPVRIEFEQSHQVPQNPAPLPLATNLGWASPYFPPAANLTAGYFGGYVFDHITSYATYSNAGFDGYVVINFSPKDPFLINQYNSLHSDVTPVSTCEFDLYSVVLHELTHDLGWLSSIRESATLIPEEIPALNFHPNAFSKIDEHFLFHGNINTPATMEKYVIPIAGLPSLNPSPTFTTPPPPLGLGVMDDSKTYLYPTGRHLDNQPVYGGVSIFGSNPTLHGSYLSHMDKQIGSPSTRYSYSTGYTPHYVMGPQSYMGMVERNYSIPKIRALQTMGYALSGTFLNSNAPNSNSTWGSFLNSNHLPVCTTDINPDFQNYGQGTLSNHWGEHTNPPNTVVVDGLFMKKMTQGKISKIKDKEFVIFPNPAETQLSIKYILIDQKDATFIMYDILGREVKKIELPFTSNIVTLLVNDLMPGVYNYKQICNGIQTRTGKIVIEK